MLRLSLHPDGMAPRIVNLAQWGPGSSLASTANPTSAPELVALHHELSDYPGNASPASQDTDPVIASLRYRHRDTELALISTVATSAPPKTSPSPSSRSNPSTQPTLRQANDSGSSTP